MKILLFGLNSSYTHTALALHSLHKSIENYEPLIIEHTINGHYHDFLSDIFLAAPDVLCFSCYIWNIEIIETLLRDVKKVLPGVIIICGGPEVSYDCVEFLDRNPAVNYCIAGEAEEAFKDVVDILSGISILMPTNVAYRNQSDIISNRSVGLIKDLDKLKFPYDREFIVNNKNKIFYYETSRGCPYSCSYCMSSVEKAYRKKSLDKVFSEIEIFNQLGVRLVKLTDRTFNADKKRALQILEHISDMKTETLFHLEIAADLLNEDLIDVLNRMPKGRIQIEAGIQTTNPETTEAICRNISFERSAENLKNVIKKGNVHVHTDLIAGLPYEDLKSFERSFNDVYNIGGHHLQLGFLKLLKGTKIKGEYDQNNSCYTEKPPYEILKTPWMSYEDLLVLKNTETAVERFSNSSNFTFVLEYIFLQKLFTPFLLFSFLGSYLKDRGYLSRPLSAYECFDVFAHFIQRLSEIDDEHKNVILILLKMDLACSFPYRKLPSQFKDRLNYTLVKKEQENEFIKTYTPDPLSLKILNEQRLNLSSLSLFNEIPDDAPVRYLEIDYARKSMTGRYSCRLL